MGAVVALMMTVILSVPVLAAEGTTKTGTITIKNAEPEQTYKAYRLFDLSYDAQGKHYGYTVNKEWEIFFTGEGSKWVTIDKENGNVTLKNSTEPSTTGQGITESEMQALAQAALKYAETNPVNPVETKNAIVGQDVVFNNLKLGYYLVSSSKGALCALDTTDTEVEMYEKNTTPTINKSADKTNAAYGTNVHYTIPFTRGGYIWGDYVITDIMTGLDMTEVQKNAITIKTKTEGIDIKPECRIVYTPNSPQSGSNTLKVTIPEETLKKYKSGTEFVLEYDAVAKQTVTMDNKVFMEYKNGPDKPGKTPVYEVKVANYEFNIKKTDEQQKPLEGATFELYTDENCTPDHIMKFVKDDRTNTYRLAEADETFTTTITAGQAKIEGLAAGTYYLKETAAPDGYNKLVKPVKVEIIENLNQEGTSAFDQAGNRIDPTIKVNGTDVTKEENQFILQVVNKTGTELPSTGGIGTTIFYVVGGVLILAAVAILIVKKRKDQ